MNKEFQFILEGELQMKKRTCLTQIELPMKSLICELKVPAHGQGKVHFTLIELLVVIAIIAILPRSKNSFFLLFSAIRRFCIL